MHQIYAQRDFQKYGFLDPYNIQFSQQSSNDIQTYIQIKLIQEKISY